MCEKVFREGSIAWIQYVRSYTINLIVYLTFQWILLIILYRFTDDVGNKVINTDTNRCPKYSKESIPHPMIFPNLNRLYRNELRLLVYILYSRRMCVYQRGESTWSRGVTRDSFGSLGPRCVTVKRWLKVAALPCTRVCVCVYIYVHARVCRRGVSFRFTVKRIILLSVTSHPSFCPTG